MLLFKKKKIKQYVHDVEEYIDDNYVDPNIIVHYSVEDEDEEDYLEQETSTDRPQCSSRPKPGSGVKYSSRDYGNITSSDEMFRSLRIILDRNPNASMEMLSRMVNPTFVDQLLQYIEEKHLKDSQVYKAAGVDRSLFSKIVSDRTYKPARDTCIALCIGLRLNLWDSTDLLEKAGYTLSQSSKRDIAIKFFLVEGIYQLQEINEVLDRLGLKILGRE